MNSAVPGPKRPAPCRYFFNSGTCFYGDECQFLHDPSRLKQRQFAAGRSTPPFDPTGEMPVTSEANNGDQFFNATFSTGNGLPFIGAQPNTATGNKGSANRSTATTLATAGMNTGVMTTATTYSDNPKFATSTYSAENAKYAAQATSTYSGDNAKYAAQAPSTYSGDNAKYAAQVYSENAKYVAAAASYGENPKYATAYSDHQKIGVAAVYSDNPKLGGTTVYHDNSKFAPSSYAENPKFAASTFSDNPKFLATAYGPGDNMKYATTSYSDTPKFAGTAYENQKFAAAPYSDNPKLFLSPAKGSDQETAAMVNSFAGMNVNAHGENDFKGVNPGASEFIPKSATLSHSASTPSFASMVPVTTANHVGQHNVMPMSAGTSPVHSPGLSPNHSPLSQRRNKSPKPLNINNANAANENATIQENVGGTTYFYTSEELAAQLQGVMVSTVSMYPGVPAHVAHLKPKPNMVGFGMSEEHKLEILNKQALTLMQIDPEQNPDIPHEVDNYQNLFPLEPPQSSALQKSSTFGYPTTCYKATCTKDGLVYCLRRIHGYRLTSTKCMAVIDLWKKIQHTNIVQLREVFTTKAFNDLSIVFVYDFHAGAETLMHRHFTQQGRINGFNAPFMGLDSRSSRQFPKGKMAANRAAQAATNLLPECIIWNYIIQLTSALRTIHAAGLACRVMDPTKILLTSRSRLWLNCVGIFDVLGFDSTQSTPLAMMPHYQQEDMVSLGKVVLALACNSVFAIQRDHIQSSMELVARNYSTDLKNLILYLLTNHNRVRSVNDIMPMVGARFYTQLEASQLMNDVLENELSKEVENSRLFRLVCKLGTVNDRPEFHMDPAWSETGDRYLLKLYRDYLFHQVDENGAPWIDMAHVVQSLNKLDAGTPERLCLTSRDHQTVLLVSYADLKQSFEAAYSEIIQASQIAEQQSVGTLA
ncbi:PAN2-PAN3 deadenylation complex subunit pan3-like isoform X2 [Lineus longissimus]|uniref:PAN2-PAN3 deadenylation complex subunit pan3-like isoform X2 n=1 Tax=Lineus longissimus TaxID=88925 RepID=UPI002B4E20E5